MSHPTHAEVIAHTHTHTHTHTYIYIYIYVCVCVCLCVRIEIQVWRHVLLKTMEQCLFIIHNWSFSSLVVFLVSDPSGKEIVDIFYSSTFDHTFGCHQEPCLSWQLRLRFIVLIFSSVFILKWPVGTFSAFCFKTFSWKVFNRSILLECLSNRAGDFNYQK